MTPIQYPKNDRRECAETGGVGKSSYATLLDTSFLGPATIDVASFALLPVQIGAHSGPQLRDLIDRVGAYRERL